MESQSELLRYVVSTFERLNISYFVTGSFASSHYGEFRTTVDIDIVADLQTEHTAQLLAAFQPPDFYVSEDAVRDAVNTRFQFNILHIPTGLKIDVIVLAGGDFDQSRRSRVRRLDAGPNFEAWFASPEDVVLKKLLYFLEGGSEKHLRDIVGILRVSGEAIDQDYITQWATQFGVLNIWNAVLVRTRQSE